MAYRVLFVDFTNTFGGAFEFAIAMSERLTADQECRVALVSAQEEHVLAERQLAGVPYYKIKAYQRIHPMPQAANIVSRVFNSASDVLFGEVPRSAQLLRIGRNFRPQVIHLNNLINIQQSGVFAARLLGASCVVCHQDFEYPSRLAQFASRFVDRHIAISSTMREHLIEFGVDPAKIRLIHHGVDTNKFSPEAGAANLAVYGIPSGAPVFAIFGRLVDWKGHEVFLQAAKQVLAAIPEAYGLIVGSTSDGDPQYETELRQLSQQLGIGERVVFAGYLPQTAQLMNATSVILHLSTRPEPFGLVVAEAMACGKPVVGMSEGGPADIIEDGVSGLLVEPRNPDAVAAAVCRLLNDKSLLATMGGAARTRVENYFSLDQCARNYGALYRELLLEGRAASSTTSIESMLA